MAQEVDTIDPTINDVYIVADVTNSLYKHAVMTTDDKSLWGPTCATSPPEFRPCRVQFRPMPHGPNEIALAQRMSWLQPVKLDHLWDLNTLIQLQQNSSFLRLLSQTIEDAGAHALPWRRHSQPFAFALKYVCLPPEERQAVKQFVARSDNACVTTSAMYATLNDPCSLASVGSNASPVVYMPVCLPKSPVAIPAIAEGKTSEDYVAAVIALGHASVYLKRVSLCGLDQLNQWAPIATIPVCKKAQVLYLPSLKELIRAQTLRYIIIERSIKASLGWSLFVLRHTPPAVVNFYLDEQGQPNLNAKYPDVLLDQAATHWQISGGYPCSPFVFTRLACMIRKSLPSQVHKKFGPIMKQKVKFLRFLWHPDRRIVKQ